MRKVWAGHGRQSARMLERCRKVVVAVNGLESSVRSRTDADLLALAGELRRRRRSGDTAESLLAEAAAVVRETARRVLDQRLDDVQLMGGVALHDGALVEMKTGEGKTLTILLPAYLGALTGRGVHVMTANNYLAERDADAMRPVYQALGMTCGLVPFEPSASAERRTVYAADVTYGTADGFAYDYLRDHLVRDVKQTVQRGRHLAIVDEADLILFDDARRTPSVTRKVRHTGPDYAAMTGLVGRLRTGVHYTVDPVRKLVTLTEAGIDRMEDLLGTTDLHATADPDLLRTLDCVLQAKEVYQRDRDYVVEDGVVRPIDTATGRVSASGTFGGGLLPALAVKEGLDAPPEQRAVATTHTHLHLRGYEKLTAITGVAAEAEAYRRIYGLETVLVPTRRPVQRVDRPVATYLTSGYRLQAAVRRTAERRAAGQPVLLGTASVAQAEEVSAALTARGIPHELLSAKNHAAEAGIIARAGGVGAVTVVTRMVGRGVDIKLGGPDADDSERDAVVRSGGLYVLALDIYETRRLELHMRGRAGRRGDPGESEVFVSLDDVSLTSMMGPTALRVMRKVGTPVPMVSPLMTRELEKVLDKRTARQMQWLCDSVRYDEVTGRQRDLIYAQRRDALESRGLREWVRSALDATLARCAGTAAGPGPLTRPGRLGGEGAERLHRDLKRLYPTGLTPDALAALAYTDLIGALHEDAHNAYAVREAALGRPVTTELERRVCLSVIDRSWCEHLQALDDLSANTTLHSLTGSDPLAHFQQEAAQLFAALLERIERETVGYLFNLEVEIEAAS
jgi:preprotein translocase subunit SecA